MLWVAIHLPSSEDTASWFGSRRGKLKWTPFQVLEKRSNPSELMPAVCSEPEHKL